MLCGVNTTYDLLLRLRLYSVFNFVFIGTLNILYLPKSVKLKINCETSVSVGYCSVSSSANTAIGSQGERNDYALKP